MDSLQPFKKRISGSRTQNIAEKEHGLHAALPSSLHGRIQQKTDQSRISKLLLLKISSSFSSSSSSSNNRNSSNSSLKLVRNGSLESFSISILRFVGDMGHTESKLAYT